MNDQKRGPARYGMQTMTPEELQAWQQDRWDSDRQRIMTPAEVEARNRGDALRQMTPDELREFQEAQWRDARQTEMTDAEAQAYMNSLSNSRPETPAELTAQEFARIEAELVDEIEKEYGNTVRFTRTQLATRYAIVAVVSYLIGAAVCYWSIAP